jgi:hypothetical protein
MSDGAAQLGCTVGGMHSVAHSTRSVLVRVQQQRASVKVLTARYLWTEASVSRHPGAPLPIRAILADIFTALGNWKREAGANLLCMFAYTAREKPARHGTPARLQRLYVPYLQVPFIQACVLTCKALSATYHVQPREYCQRRVVRR